ncbi:MAG: hypothetical protein D6723_05815 [Acidobacteria bacterium]|nr:MAG: hypothetical protein D6723_05815 [Acidobacteriota bacterium]
MEWAQQFPVKRKNGQWVWDVSGGKKSFLRKMAKTALEGRGKYGESQELFAILFAKQLIFSPGISGTPPSV